VTLTAPHPNASGSLLEVTRSIRVEPSSTVAASLFAPAGLYGAGLGIAIDGSIEREVIPMNLDQHTYEGRPSVLISRGALNAGFRSASEAELKNPTGELAHKSVASESPVADWSDNWLGYSGYDGVVVTASELAGMPAPISTALWQYVECGGSLLVVGSHEPPQPWRDRKLEGVPLATYHVGFGQCVLSNTTDLRSLAKGQWEYAASSWEAAQKPWRSAAGIDVNRSFPVTENVSVPVRGMFLVMLIFVALIGPVNVFVLWRKKKRMWLLWTVPLISFVTCLGVSAFSIASEGWGGRARTAGFTILDETSHRATTIGMTAFYAPLTPGDGLHFSYETEVSTPTPLYDFSYSRGPGFRSIDWSRDQHLETGWVMARRPAHFMIRRSESRRERMVINRAPDGSLSVVNGLGADVRRLWLADKDGRVYEAKDIKAGATAGLTLAVPKKLASGKVQDLRKPYTDDWTSMMKSVTNPSSLLRPGCYLAVLDSCPFIEEGLRGVKERRAEALVYGIMKASDEN